MLLVASVVVPVDGFADPPKIKVQPTAVAGQPISVVVTAMKKGKRNKNFKGSISLTTDDSQAVTPGPHKFKRKDKGRFTFTGLQLRTAGARTVSAKSSSKTVTVSAGPAATLNVSPPSSTAVSPPPTGVSADFSLVGSPETSAVYSATGADQFGNGLGDLTTSATWSISPDGSCVGSECSPAGPGAHTVTATVGAASDDAGMTVPPLEDNYTMTCQGEHYDIDQALANGCEVIEPDPGRGTAATAIFKGTFDDCDDVGTSFSGALITDSRQHVNPTVSGFHGTTGGPSEFFKFTFDDVSGPCAEEYELDLDSGGGALFPADCYRVTLSGTYTANSAPFATDTALFSGAGSAHLAGPLDSGHISNDDSANLIVEIEPICAPPRNERVDFQADLHF